MADHVSVKGKCVLFIGLLFIMPMVTLYETGLARLILVRTVDDDGLVHFIPGHQ